MSVLSSPRVPKGNPEHGDGVFCAEKEMSEIALPGAPRSWENEARGRLAEAQWIRWNELMERWRWASVIGERSHLRRERDLRAHEAKLEFTDLDFCELASRCAGWNMLWS